MTIASSVWPLDPEPDFEAERDMLALSGQARRIIAVAGALAESRRPVDLAGLQDVVGLVCAKALDLPSHRSGFAKLELQHLVAELDTLRSAMQANPS